jgi:hypothetical protein
MKTRLLMKSSNRSHRPLVSPQRLARTVIAAAKLMPARATCLPQAICGQILLAAYGYDTKLQIGVTNTLNHGIEAHAWVEYDGDVLVGNVPNL